MDAAVVVQGVQSFLNPNEGDRNFISKSNVLADLWFLWRSRCFRSLVILHVEGRQANICEWCRLKTLVRVFGGSCRGRSLLVLGWRP